MRVVFVMQYPGYLRYYDSTVKLLADRGHEVTLVFEQPDKQAEGLSALENASARVAVKNVFPARSLVWDAVPRAIRRVVDWARYLDPRLADAHYLRNRTAQLMPRSIQKLARIERLGPRSSRAVVSALMALEKSIPPYRSAREFITNEAPDVLVVTPLVMSGSREVDIVKAAKRAGVPTVLAVASWDHLSSKGLIRVPTDTIIVWNEIQKQEAEQFHDIGSARIVVTGAQPWDRWFERQPSTTPSEFRRKVVLPEDRDFVLFVGSTASISAPDAELEFVREWIAALRASEFPEVRDLGVLVRPHPYNPGRWIDAELSDLGGVAIWPRAGANPVDEDDRTDYFDSMFHAAAVVGINTSAMIESAIVGRPVLTVRSPRFDDSQEGTVHFSYLLPENGGFVSVAYSLEEHIEQLAALRLDPERTRSQIDRFVRTFVRPYGRERAATPFVADAIEDTAHRALRRPIRMPLRYAPLRVALWVVGAVRVPLDGHDRARLILRGAGAARRLIEAFGCVIERGGLALGVALRKAEQMSNLTGRTPVTRMALAVEVFLARVNRRLHRIAKGFEARAKHRGDAMFADARARALRRKEALVERTERERFEQGARSLVRASYAADEAKEGRSARAVQ
jgi:hypothetical protein